MKEKQKKNNCIVEMMSLAITADKKLVALYFITLIVSSAVTLMFPKSIVSYT